MRDILFATNNEHKIAEVRSILGPDFRVLSLSDFNYARDLPETQNSFKGNALQKARYAFAHFNTPCFADDSGLEVEALNGSPGVLSARYAGRHGNSEENINLLLENLQGIANRSARFKTVIALVTNVADAYFFEGIVNGSILDQRRGAYGFGYDPVFLPDGYSKTFAEMSAREKNAISHRAEAVRKLADYLKQKFI
jgi:XTP/dITP diphosphohydrolase